MNRKFELIKKVLIESNYDAMVFVSDQNRFWISGFQSSFGFAITNKEKTYLFLDGRYLEKAKSEIKNDLVEIIEYKSFIQFKEFFEQNNIKKILVESEYIVFNELKNFEKIVNVVASFDTKKLRIIKDDDELKLMIEAANIVCKALNWLITNVRPGMTEIEVANLSYQKMFEYGASKQSFDTIVASGPNGAYPHHKPTKRVIQEGDLVTIDMGCIYKGYCSDVTRTFPIGELKNETLKKAYEVVLSANIAGINAIKDGVTGAEVDKVTRSVIDATEFKEYFVHSTGHGVGIDVHELPNVSKAYNGKLLTNAVVTVEPGIYIPGVGGIRIEDMVLVTKDKPIVLTRELKK